jgi:hypothetical protein
MYMQSRWFKNAVIYCLEVDVFKDGNGDGIGDFIGLRQGLSYDGFGRVWSALLFTLGVFGRPSGEGIGLV